VHKNGVNGLNGTAHTDGHADPPPKWDCQRQGHGWQPAPGGSPTARTCIHCPALGGPCPDCLATGRGDASIGTLICQRCRGTGHVELVEISRAAVDRAGRRLKWLIDELTHLWHESPELILREIDGMIDAGISRGTWAGRPLPGPTGRTARASPRAKEPRNGTTRSGASAGHTPSTHHTKSSLPDFRGPA
jgi:hypothetical protein